MSKQEGSITTVKSDTKQMVAEAEFQMLVEAAKHKLDEAKEIKLGADKKKKKEYQDDIEKLYSALSTRKQGELTYEDCIKEMSAIFSNADYDWIGTIDDKEKERALERVQSEIKCIIDEKESQILTPAEIIVNSSALQGVYYTSDTKKLLTERSQLLTIDNTTNLKTANKSQIDEVIEFDRRTKHDEFDRAIKSSGWGLAMDLIASDKVVSEKDLAASEEDVAKGIGYHYKTDNKHEQSLQKTNSSNYFSRNSFSVVPIKSWEPQLHELSLCKNAVNALLRLNNMLHDAKSQEAPKMCIDFFEKFGSHFNMSSVYFGGIYKMETTYTNDAESAKDTAISMVRSQHTASFEVTKNIFGVAKVGVDLSGHEHSGSAESSGKTKYTKGSEITMKVEKLGGPKVSNTMQLWKIGLTSSQGTWTVVDRGKHDSSAFIGVWDIITQNHSSEFDDSDKLSQFLIQMWKKINWLDFKDDNMTISIFSDDTKFMELINNLSLSLLSECSSEQFVTQIEDLYNMVHDINMKLGKSQEWIQFLKANRKVVDIFYRLTLFEYSQKNEIELRQYITKLLDFANGASFPREQEIRLWLNTTENLKGQGSVVSIRDISSIGEFISLVGGDFLRSVQTRKHTESEESHCNKSLTVELAMAVFKLLNVLDENNDALEYILLLALVIPLGYNVMAKGFCSQITVKKLEDFYRQSKQLIQKYALYKGTDNAPRKQAWIVWHLISNTRKASTQNEGTKTIIEHLKNLENKVDAQIYHLILQAHNREELESLLVQLKRIVDEQIVAWNHVTKLDQSSLNNPSFQLKEDERNDNPSDTEYREPSNAFSDILKQLGILQYFPGKLSIPDVLTIRDDIFKKPENLTEIPWAILRSIISNDFRFRDDILNEFIQASKAKTATVRTYKQDDLLKKVLERNLKKQEFKQPDLHPTDVFLAIFVCCDAFLRRILVEKMHACQLAIPLIYNDYVREKLTFSLWPVRGVLLDGNMSVAARKVLLNGNMSEVTKPLKTISFLRVGEVMFVSKSKTINQFLRDHSEEHKTFFHKDCPLGMNRRQIANGMVEASWYVPSCGDKDERDPLALLNLRGDAYRFGTQLDILLVMSDVIVLFIKYEDMGNKIYIDVLSKIHRNDAPVMLVTEIPKDTADEQISSHFISYGQQTQMNESKTNLMFTNDLENERNTNEIELNKNLTDGILKLLERFPECSKCCLEDLSVKFQEKIHTDERSSHCDYGRKLANCIMLQIQNESNTSRDAILPLQGASLWNAWSRKQKMQHKARKSDRYDTDEVLMKDMKTIRRKQVDICNKAPEIIANVVQILYSHIGNDETTQFFLYWLKHALDNKSRCILPALRQELKNAFKNYEDSSSSENERAVEKAEAKLANAMFGLEHIFREIGQIYEAFMYCGDTMKCEIEEKTMTILQHLPVIVAKLLLFGFPFEIMDGDVENVPLLWIKAVFQELERLTCLKYKKTILSISVLGIQSSGKSTLLNTMFGLQFAVSAGRCTRGIFIQLVPVDKKRSSLNCDYVMVLDTEGLRAPELGTKQVHHDNELALLVTGMADVVIINIKGETMADMENVLQIVVHALLRLQQSHETLALKQSCWFVHENVSTQDAKELKTNGNHKNVYNLDKMTKEVALQEHMANIISFKDVITFDPSKHINYLPDLWHGSAPMAAISTNYSEGAVNVAKCILSDIVETKRKLFNMHETALHMECLWKAILTENFVFSFRNCLEVKAYDMLESEYQRQVWELEKLKLTFCNENVIHMFSKCEKVTELHECASNLKKHFLSAVSDKLKESEDKLMNFLQTSEVSDHMIHWKEVKRRNLQAIKVNLCLDLELKIKREKRRFEIVLENIDFQHDKEKEINIRAKEFANSLKGKPKPSHEELTSKFNELWVQWINDIAPETATENRLETIDDGLNSAIFQKFEKVSALLKKCLGKDSDISESIPRLKFSLDSEITKRHINAFSWKQLLKTPLNETKKAWNGYTYILQQAKDVVNKLFDSIDKYFESLSIEDSDYDNAQFSKILNMIQTTFNEHNAKALEEKTFTMKPELEATVVIHVLRYSSKQFKALCQIYNEKHNLRVKLWHYKEHAHNLFFGIVYATKAEITAADGLCLELKQLLKDNTMRLIPILIEDTIIKKFNCNKYHFIKATMEDLAHKEDFNEFIEYITNTEAYVSKKIAQITHETIFQSINDGPFLFSIWVKSSINALVRDFRIAAMVVTQHCVQNPSQSWVDVFFKQIDNKNLMLEPSSFKRIAEYKITDFENFHLLIKERLPNMEKELIDEVIKHANDNSLWTSQHIAIFEKLWGCLEKCPWCYEPCRNTSAGHETLNKTDRHMCIQHRPQGLRKVIWGESNELVIEACSFSVQSSVNRFCGTWCGCRVSGCSKTHPDRDYQEYMPNWDIVPSHDMDSSKYWAWFMVKYETQLADHYKAKLNLIPDSWKEISKEEAIKSLSKCY